MTARADHLRDIETYLREMAALAPTRAQRWEPLPASTKAQILNSMSYMNYNMLAHSVLLYCDNPVLRPVLESTRPRGRILRTAAELAMTVLDRHRWDNYKQRRYTVENGEVTRGGNYSIQLVDAARMLVEAPAAPPPRRLAYGSTRENRSEADLNAIHGDIIDLT